MYVTIRVGGPTRLIMGSTRLSRVLGGPGQKLTRTNIWKKIQPNPAQTRGGPGWPIGCDPLWWHGGLPGTGSQLRSPQNAWFLLQLIALRLWQILQEHWGIALLHCPMVAVQLTPKWLTHFSCFDLYGIENPVMHGMSYHRRGLESNLTSLKELI